MVEPGESSREALVREIQEELNVRIKVGRLIGRIEYDYPSFHLSMDCFWCEIADGEIVLKEAESARWLKPDELHSVNWLPADRVLVDAIAEQLARDSGVILH